MPEIEPEHPISYRQELAAPIFQKLRARESCAVIGAASMGKSRLLQFLLRADVRRHYLADAAATMLLVWLDCNRMAEFTAWGLHELCLTGLIESCGEQPATSTLRANLTEWRKEAIVTQNGLLAQRYVELALQLICQEQRLQVCFILDEFDEAYRSLPPQALASLRALRDHHKYWLTYLLLLRDHPQELRPPDECEGFYELISRSVLGLHPYSEADSRRIIEQVVTRRSHELNRLMDKATLDLLRLSGGHPGLLIALIDALTQEPPLGETWDNWAHRQSKAREECRKLWQGLRREERTTLHQLAQGLDASIRERESLLLKGLIKAGSTATKVCFFSPLFQEYAAGQAPTQGNALRVDRQTGIVWLNGASCQELTPKEFELLAYLYDHVDEICEVEQIITTLYPGDEAFRVDGNNIAALVRRVRGKIEPNPNVPRFLINVRGRGYKLVDEAEKA